MKRKRKILSLLICLLMFTSFIVACAPTGKSDDVTSSESTTVPTPEKTISDNDYLNLDSTWPVVKEGYDISLDILTDYTAPRSNWWIYAFMEDMSNIKLNVTKVSAEAKAEHKNLIMASGDIPDIIHGFNFSATELVSYGQNQSMFLDCAPYITSELTPTIVKRFEERPDVKTSITLSDGGIYFLPRISSNKNVAYLSVSFWNDEALGRLNLDMPETIDEAIETLYAFKNQDPYNMGNANLPIVGCRSYWPSGETFFTNAYGFLRGNMGIDIRKNKVVFSAAEDAYGEYLRLMNQFFKDGIISEDYFTMDLTSLKAIAEGGKTMFVGIGAPYVIMNKGWENFYAAKPLTSDYNDTRQCGIATDIDIGGWVISANTKYPDVCMRLSDWTFTDQAVIYAYNGPYEDSEDTYGMFERGWSIGDDNVITYGDLTREQFLDANDVNFAYGSNHLVGIGRIYYIGEGYGGVSLAKRVAGLGWEKVEYNMEDGDEHYRATSTLNVLPYAVPMLNKNLLFFPIEVSERLVDLQTLIEGHASTECAKFITGNRPFSEFPAFQEELKALGVEEYVKYYEEAYAKNLAK